MNFLTLLCNNVATAANTTPAVTQMKNEYDVAIAAIVCGSFVIVAIIVAFLFCWRKKKRGTTISPDKTQKNNDNDRIYNEKMMYVARLLDLLKDQTKAESKLKKDECKHYEDTLLDLIKNCETKMKD